MDNPISSALRAVAAASGDEPDRTYRLQRDEYVPDGMRRIARGQLDNAQDDLDGASRRAIGDAVHEARKRLKRLRAALRLTRDAIGAETYERENTTFRMAGRRLSSARDAEVMLETLDALRERFADELPQRVTAAIRSRLEDERKHAVARRRDDDREVRAVLGDIDDARARTPAWTFDHDGFDALAPGLRRIYRRGRKRMRAACKDPSPENLHEWRKRVKDLWHATQIVRPADPKRLKRVSRRAHDLADLLGDNHDLHVLREYVERHPQCFEDEASKAGLLAVIDRRAGHLRDRALQRGPRLYKRPPKRFVRDIERGWHKRAASKPQPLAG
jgi:CHAD domain-containing protein